MGELDEPVEALRRSPGDRGAWEGLARASVRLARLPAGLVRGLHLAPLLGLVASTGPEGGFVPLLLHLLDLRLAREEGPLGSAWQGARRPRELGGVAYDPLTGLPLRVARRRGGVVMALCGGGQAKRAVAGRREPRSLDVDPFYVDRARVPWEEIARFARETGRDDFGRAFDGSANGTADAAFALAYAWSLGARLIRAEELAVAIAGVRLMPAPMPDPDDDLRAAAKARWRDGNEAARAAGPWGLREPEALVWRADGPDGQPIGIYLPELATEPADWTLSSGHWIRAVIRLHAPEPGLADRTTREAPAGSVLAADP